MKDIDQIRRDNMHAIEREMGSATIAATAIGMTLAQFLNLRDGAKDSKTGIPRGMRKATAWKIEDGAKKPRGWLDIDHSEEAIGLGAKIYNLSEAAMNIALAVNQMSPLYQDALLALITQDQQKKEEIPPQVEDRSAPPAQRRVVSKSAVKALIHGTEEKLRKNDS